MPIVDVQVVMAANTAIPGSASTALAEALATVLGAESGRVWIRLRELAEYMYAENGASTHRLLPVFVTVLHADLPTPERLATQADAQASAVAACLNRGQEQVHIEYAPSGRGRIAFGGKLLR